MDEMYVWDERKKRAVGASGVPAATHANSKVLSECENANLEVTNKAMHALRSALCSSAAAGSGAHIVEKSLAVMSMLIGKNIAYGDSALKPMRVFSRANEEEQLLVRIDDKLSRIARGRDYADEDVVMDLIGYLILLSIQRDRAK